MKCWCTIPIPCSIAAFVEPSSIGLPCSRICALVGRVEPVEDVHQRRLAGAVLAEQRVHLAAAEVEVDVVVGEHAREPLRDPAQLEERRLSHARAILPRRAEAARELLRGGPRARPRSRVRCAGRAAHADRAARRAEHDVLAAVVDAGDRVAHDDAAATLGSSKSRELERRHGSAGARRRPPRRRTSPPCAITTTAPRAIAPSAASLHARRDPRRPRVQDVAPRQRRRATPRANASASARSSGPTHATRAVGAALLARDEPGDDAAEHAPPGRRGARAPTRFALRAPLGRSRRRARSATPGVAAAARGDARGGVERRARRGRAAVADRVERRRARPRAPGTLSRSGPTTPTRSPAAAARRADGDAWSSPAVRAPQPQPRRRTQAAAMSAARIASSSPQRNGAGLAARPVRTCTVRAVYLTVAGMPLILPAFSSLNCAATAVLIDGGHLRAPLAVADAVDLGAEDDVLAALQLAGLRAARSPSSTATSTFLRALVITHEPR